MSTQTTPKTDVALKNTNKIIQQEIKITQAIIKNQRKIYKKLTRLCDEVFHELNYLEAIEDKLKKS